jgi:hypothetical protein
MAKVRRFATSAACLVMGNRPRGDSKKGGDYSSNQVNNRTVQSIKGGQIASHVGTFAVPETSIPA